MSNSAASENASQEQSALKIFSEEQAPIDFSYFHQMLNGNDLSSLLAAKNKKQKVMHTNKKERLQGKKSVMPPCERLSTEAFRIRNGKHE